jgi:hypothetical protein
MKLVSVSRRISQGNISLLMLYQVQIRNNIDDAQELSVNTLALWIGVYW